MSECTCHKNYTLDTLIPKVGVITDIRQETPDVKTFRVEAPEGGKLFEHMPGQCAMVCAPGVSEGMFSITSSPKIIRNSVSKNADPFPIIFIAFRLEMRSQSADHTEIIFRWKIN